MADTMIRSEALAGGVHLVTLDHPKVNALCVELLTQLERTAREIAETEPRAVVLTGGERVFAAGADITEFAANPDPDAFEVASEEVVARIGRAFLNGLGAVADLPCPTIAAVNGFALGGGCELAMACDFRVAAESAKLGQPEILLGIIPGGGGTQRLTRLVGPARAKELVFSGRMLGAEEAYSIGLVDRVVQGDATEAALEWAAKLASGPRRATALAKRAIDDGLEGSLERGLELEQGLFVESFATADAAAGVASFLRDGPGHADFSA